MSFPNLMNLALADNNVEIVALSKKGTVNEGQGLPGVIFIKHLGSEDFFNGNFNRYVDQGRIAFVVDGKRVQIHEKMAQKHFQKQSSDQQVCKVQFKQGPALEDAEVVGLSVEEYDEVLITCREIVQNMQKSESDKAYKKRSFKETVKADPIYAALKEIIIQGIVKQLNRITESYIEAMQEARESDKKAAKEYAERVRKVEERLLKERLTKDQLKEVYAKIDLMNENLSREKSHQIEKSTGHIVSEAIV